MQKVIATLVGFVAAAAAWLPTVVEAGNLGAVHFARGEVAEAEVRYRHALVIKERALGSRHPGLATTLNNLAVLCKSQKRLDEAEQLSRRAVAISTGSLGPNHPVAAACRATYSTLGGADAQIPEQ
jgi:tetratricopeptide (TPR) repeat protein